MIELVGWLTAGAIGLTLWALLIEASSLLALAGVVAGIVAVTGFFTWIVDGKPWWRE